MFPHRRSVYSLLSLLVFLAAACSGGGDQSADDSLDSGTAECGNGVREGDEVCDGADLAGMSCADTGLGAGVLSCADNCTDYNTAGCCAPQCGNRECGLDPVCGAPCGSCQGGTCNAAGHCEPSDCVPTTCQAAGAQCGIVQDGCGGTLSCGSCSGGLNCGAQTPNQCGEGQCTPLSCSAIGAQCGVVDDGCGNALNCGGCTGTDTCGGGGVPNQCGGAATVAWSKVATGSFHTCALKEDGSLWCWGRNVEGQLGLGTAGGSISTPTRVGVSFGWTAVATGGMHTCGVQYDHLYCWGDNGASQLGDGTSTDRSTPTLIEGQATWSRVALGYASSCAFDTSMFAWRCFGNNDQQQIADGITGDINTPTYAGSPATIAVGGGHSCRYYSNTTSTSLFCGGLNTSGQLGINSGAPNAEMSSVTKPESNWFWSNVFTGGAHSCGFGFTGLLVCWGSNQFGQLGSSPHPEIIPDYVDGLSDWATMGLGDAHTCGVKTNGNLLCWGANDAGQIGDGTLTNRSVPTFIGSGFSSVEGGYSHTCALRTDKSLYCWGDNAYGQLGAGSASSLSPIQVH